MILCKIRQLKIKKQGLVKTYKRVAIIIIIKHYEQRILQKENNRY